MAGISGYGKLNPNLQIVAKKAVKITEDDQTQVKESRQDTQNKSSEITHENLLSVQKFDARNLASYKGIVIYSPSKEEDVEALKRQQTKLENQIRGITGVIARYEKELKDLLRLQELWHKGDARSQEETIENKKLLESFTMRGRRLDKLDQYISDCKNNLEIFNNKLKETKKELAQLEKKLQKYDTESASNASNASRASGATGYEQ